MDGTADRDGAHEAARLRYELARLRDRRTVRAALALGEARRAGPRSAWAALRGRAPRLDVPGPEVVPPQPVLPHLRVLHTGEGRLLASTAISGRCTPTDAVTLLGRDRPDLVLVDGVAGWSSTSLAALVTAAHSGNVPIVTLGPAAAAALPEADLRVSAELEVPGADLELGPGVDVRDWSPAGLSEPATAERRDDPAAVTPTDARRQPVVVIRDVAALGVQRCLELVAAGALVVTGPDETLAEALGPVADEVVGPRQTLEERVLALLEDPDRRRRSSVRLRRRVHARYSTREQLLTLVAALGLDQRPSERVTVLVATRRPERLRQVTRELAAQRGPQGALEVELILLPHGDVELPDGLEGVSRIQRVGAGRPLGAVLNAGLDLATGRYIAKADDDDRYGPHHLLDQVLAVHHTGAHLIGKRVHGVFDEQQDVTLEPGPGGEEQYEDHLPGGTLLAPAEVLRAVRWRHVPRAVDTELVRAIHLAGGHAYSTHRYGYVRVRHGDHLYEPVSDWSGSPTPGFDAGLLDA